MRGEWNIANLILKLYLTPILRECLPSPEHAPVALHTCPQSPPHIFLFSLWACCMCVHILPLIKSRNNIPCVRSTQCPLPSETEAY